MLLYIVVLNYYKTMTSGQTVELRERHETDQQLRHRLNNIARWIQTSKTPDGCRIVSRWLVIVDYSAVPQASHSSGYLSVAGTNTTSQFNSLSYVSIHSDQQLRDFSLENQEITPTQP